MHELFFADAARPTPCVVLRLPLRPYAIGHELRLLARRNPFLCLSRSAFDELPVAQQITALVTAIVVAAAGDVYAFGSNFIMQSTNRAFDMHAAQVVFASSSYGVTTGTTNHTFDTYQKSF